MRRPGYRPSPLPHRQLQRPRLPGLPRLAHPRQRLTPGLPGRALEAAKQRAERVSVDSMWPARPGIPLGDLEAFACNDAGTHAVLIGYEGCFLLSLADMRSRCIVRDRIASRVAGFSPMGTSCSLPTRTTPGSTSSIPLLPASRPCEPSRGPELAQMGSTLLVAVSRITGMR